MEDESKALINAVVHEAAAPYRKMAEVVLGYVFLDDLEERRELKKQQRRKNRIDIVRESVRILEHRKVGPDPEMVAPEHIEKIMSAGEDTSVPELQQVFSRLLAAAMDPDRRPYFRQEYVDIAKKFEPLDALVLQAMSAAGIGGARWINQVADRIKRSDDEISVSGENLEQLGLLMPQDGHESVRKSAYISPKGRQIIKCIGD
jgi:hypothetical protein